MITTSEAIETFEEDLEEGRNHDNAEDQHACDNPGLAVLSQGSSRFKNHISGVSQFLGLLRYAI